MALFGRTQTEQELEWAHRAHLRLQNQTYKPAIKERERLEVEMTRLTKKMLKEREQQKSRRKLYEK